VVAPAIVIPIHDAADDVRRCVASVLAHAPSDAIVVLVDDASEDAALCALLEDWRARDARVRLLRNPSNLGFVRSANRGFREVVGRDVIVLNSDTVVPPRFAERLAEPLVTRREPASSRRSRTTARSSACPGSCATTPCPTVLDVDAFDALIATTSPRLRPEVVTAHGFCLYLRAEMLDRVGLFDEDRFERGYGEENDLCERAKAAGFEIRLCDDLFVYHRGGASFGNEARELELRHLELLDRLHPGYRAAAQSFIAENPLAEHHASLRYHLEGRSTRRHPAMLFLLHADPFADARRQSIGGTQYHAIDLVESLALPRALVAWPEEAGTRVAEIFFGDVSRRRTHLVPRPASSRSFAERRFTLRDIAAEAHLDELLDVFDVGAVHVHHLAWWPIGLWRRLAERDVPYAYMVQDYYCVCPSWNLLDLARVARCACVDASLEQRRSCLASWFVACGLAPPEEPRSLLAEHRAEFRALLEGAAAVIAPCEATRAIVTQAHDGANLRWHVIPYGYERVGAPDAASPHLRPEARSRPPGPLRVALVGAVAAPWKGADDALAAMRLAGELAIEWHVFGDSDAFGFPERARQAVGDATRLHFHGRYAREEIVASLVEHAIDVSLLLSPWDETFCFTLSESWAAGVPAIVSDRGALAERSRASGAGLVARDPGEVVACLDRPRDAGRRPRDAHPRCPRPSRPHPGRERRASSRGLSRGLCPTRAATRRRPLRPARSSPLRDLGARAELAARPRGELVADHLAAAHDDHRPGLAEGLGRREVGMAIEDQDVGALADLERADLALAPGGARVVDRPGAQQLGHEIAPRKRRRPGDAPLAALAAASSSAACAATALASISFQACCGDRSGSDPGLAGVAPAGSTIPVMTKCRSRSITRVPSPMKGLTSRFDPMATMRPSLAATASTQGRAESPVKIRP
jgi:GT2 family glycosyltransferase/glycosyltransferase involved in cell wall biosynthesis